MVEYHKNNIQKAIELALNRERAKPTSQREELNYLVFEQFSVIYSCTFMDAKWTFAIKSNCFWNINRENGASEWKIEGMVLWLRVSHIRSFVTQQQCVSSHWPEKNTFALALFHTPFANIKLTEASCEDSHNRCEKILTEIHSRLDNHRVS